jgi:chemotaxis protein histidine kinase CheA
MTSPLGMLDYFAMEASEYLERLRSLVDAPEAPAPAELVRYSRALRGAALMANQQPIARAANGLEGLARAVRDGQRSWDGGTKDIALRAVESLTGYVKRSAQWTQADGQAAEQLAKDLEALAGGTITPLRTPSTSASAAAEGAAATLDAGARAFLARESALISSALGQAAQALRTAPPAKDVLQGVLRRMQPLRGLAALGDLPPLPDLLETVDRAITEIGRSEAPPAGAAEVFEAAAKALTRAAQDVTERGLPNADAEESQHFARLTLRAFATTSGAVSIATLLAEGSPVETGSPTTPPVTGTVERVELVSQGEYFAAAANELDRARSITQRDLRLHAFAAALKTLGDSAGGRVADFAALARDLIGSGVAASAPQDFASALRNVGTALQRIPESGPDQALADALNATIQQLLTLASEGAKPSAAAPAAAAAPAPAKSTASAFDSFFDAEAKAAKQPVTTTAPTPSSPTPSQGLAGLGTPGTGAAGGLAGAFVALASLRSGVKAPAPSIDTFIAGVSTRPKSEPREDAPPAPAPVAAPVAPKPVAAPAPAAPTPAPRPAPAAAVAPSAPSAPVASADGVVDIRDLCYSGKSALARALEVRKELTEVLANPMKAGGRMRPLIDELMDLVELAQR